MAKGNLNCCAKKNLLVLSIILLSLTVTYSQEKKQTDDSAGKQTSFEEKQKKALQYTKQETQYFPSARINFRYAVKKAVPGVVIVKYFSSGKENIDFFRRLFDKYTPGSFQEHKNLTQGFASGVTISPDGYIVTNHHVINNADSIEIMLPDQRSYTAQIIGSDRDTDLALLKIPEKNLPFIEFGSSDSAAVGDYVLTVGNPPDLPSTVTAGIISAKARNINILTERSAVESYIQTDAAVTFGNSGGALVDVNGRLIGITAALSTSTGEYAGYSFSVPVEIVKKISNDLLLYGRPVRAYLGMTVSNLNGQKARDLKIAQTTGVLIDSLQLNGAAMQAGFLGHDVILSINNHTVETVAHLLGIIIRHHPNDLLKITINRHGSLKTFNVTLMSGLQAFKAANTGKTILKALGIEVGNISATEKNTLKIPAGVKVTSISEGEISRNTSMRTGFVIIKINNKSVNTTDQLIYELMDKKGYVIVEGIYPYDREIRYYEFRIEGLTFL